MALPTLDLEGDLLVLRDPTGVKLPAAEPSVDLSAGDPDLLLCGVTVLLLCGVPDLLRIGVVVLLL